MKLGSLFDGSGGFPLAGALCGIEPVWAAEVEPYPIAVTRSRFPNMKHLGDISKINGADIEPVDIITFGSPCQGLSTAGLRKGLDDHRSVLFLQAVRIIKEMRLATNGEFPKVCLWENVPGALSSPGKGHAGEDFRAVCEELIKIIEPTAVMPEVPKKGWPYADSYIGDGWSLAYRVFDAQYWGVPQRRRRIHLVVDFRGSSAREILFERQGLRGYFAEGRMPWKAAQAHAARGSLADDRAREGSGRDRGQQLDAVAYTMVVRNGREVDSNGKSAGKGALVQTERASTINTVQDQYLFQPVAFSFDPLSSNSMKSKNPHSGCREVEVSRTIDTTDPNPSKNQGGLAIVQPVVAGVDCRNATETPECNGTLQAKSNGGFSLNCNQVVRVEYIVRRLIPKECARLQGFADWHGHLEQKTELTDAEYSFWLEVRNTHAALNNKTVKGYTKPQMLTWYNKLWTDGAEYKMWGNGIALPPAIYCMQGIAEVLNREEDDSWMQ